MIQLIFKRLLTYIPVLLVVVIITFLMIHAAPGGPFDAERVASPEIIEKLNYVSKVGEQYSEIFGLSHNLENDKKNHISKNLEFLKSKISLEDIVLTDNYDIIFYDAFAPSKQPSIWERKNIEKIYSHMNYDSVLVTYCSSGQFKRDLKSIGFKVDVLPGPKGKKEMVRAIK